MNNVPAPDTGSLRGPLFTAAAAIALVLALAFLARSAHVSLAAILWGILIAQPLIIIATTCQAWRHKLIIADPRLTFRTALESVGLAAGLNLLMPARLSELLKVVYVREQSHVPSSVALSAIAIERLTDVAVVLALAPALPVVLLPEGCPIQIVTVLIVAIMIGLLRRPIAKRLAYSLRGPFGDFLRQLVTAFGERITSPHFLSGALLGAGALLSSFLAIYVFLLCAAPISLSLLGALAVFLAGIAGGAAAMLPGAIGSYHAAVTLTLVALGVEVGSAFALSVGMHLVQYMLLLPAAFWILFSRNIGVTQLVAKSRALLAKRRSPPTSGA